MKFTSEDLMKAMGLKVGDRVTFKYGVDKVIFKVNENELEYENGKLPLFNLLNRDFEILPAPKRVGDLKCGTDIACSECPLKMITNHSCYSGKTLNEILNNVSEGSKSYNTFDQEIYDLLKARLDKEVEE